MRTPSSIVGNMTSCSIPPRVCAVQPPWCLSILIPSPSSLIGSRPLTNFPLFFFFFLFFGLSLGFPVICLGGLQCWVGLGWVGSAFFLFLAKFSKLVSFFFKIAYFILFLIGFLGCQISTLIRTLPDFFIGF
jgi:hypothetical protein